MLPRNPLGALPGWFGIVMCVGLALVITAVVYGMWQGCQVHCK